MSWENKVFEKMVDWLADHPFSCLLLVFSCLLSPLGMYLFYWLLGGH